MSAFQLLIRTTNSGTSSSTQFTLPGDSGETYDFVIDWGDGGADETINSGSSWTHTYSSGGDYTLSITESSTGGFPAIKFNNGGDKLKVLELANWGTNKWITFEDAFYGCSNLTITATDHATAVTGFVTDFSFAWFNNSLTSFPLIDTSSGTNFSFAWRDNSLTSFPLIDTSSGTSFYYTWARNSLTSFPLIDTSSGTDFRYSWFNNSLTSFPLIDTSSGTNFGSTWRQNSLTSFPLIDTSSVTTFSFAWRENSLTSFPLIDTSSGTNFLFAWFNNSLTSFPLIDTSSGTDFSGAWRDNSLTSFPLIDTSSGTNFGNAWDGNTINTGDYNALLAGLSANANNSVTWGGGSSKYHDTGQTQRDILTAAPRNWTITDGGYDATYVPPSSGAPAQNAQHNNLRNIRMAP